MDNLNYPFMKSIIHFISKYSEYYIIALILMCGYSPYKISPIALVIAGLIVLQIIFKNRITGFIIAIIFGCINLYMMLAVISEFKEFPSGEGYSYVLLSAGLGIVGANILVCCLMFGKYLSGLEKPVTV